MERRIYLLRHGVTESPGALLGQTDPPLSEEGREQGRQLAESLRDRGIERVVASRLRRAEETGRIVADALGLSLEVDPRLNEISYGQWDGKTWQQIQADDPETAERKLRAWWSVAAPGGEQPAEFLARVSRAWGQIRRHTCRVTALTAHEAVNAVLTELARRGPEATLKEFAWSRTLEYEQPSGSFRILKLETEDERA